MEVHELKEVINQRFEDLSKNLTSCFKSIDDKNTLTDKEIAAIKNTLISHDRWLWLMRGIGLVIITILSYMGIKIRF